MRLYAGEPRPDLPTVAGAWSVAGEALEFEPRFPFLEGTTYTVVAGDAVLAITRERAEGMATTRVLGAYPAAVEVPLNLLKLYVRFSAPMAEGQAERCIRLVRDPDGAAIDEPFLPMEPELWDAARRRLTILLDPGRIKRGVALHDAAGYALREGETVRLLVDAAMPDAAGDPLAAPFEQAWRVGPAVRDRVRPERWTLEAPAAGTAEALRLRFERPLDHALAGRCIRVVGADARGIPGRWELAADDATAAFQPDAPWRDGEHRVVVQAILEDLAGNSVSRVFDRDRERAEDDPLAVACLELPFTCRAG